MQDLLKFEDYSKASDELSKEDIYIHFLHEDIDEDAIKRIEEGVTKAVTGTAIGKSLIKSAILVGSGFLLGRYITIYKKINRINQLVNQEKDPEKRSELRKKLRTLTSEHIDIKHQILKKSEDLEKMKKKIDILPDHKKQLAADQAERIYNKIEKLKDREYQYNIER